MKRFKLVIGAATALALVAAACGSGDDDSTGSSDGEQSAVNPSSVESDGTSTAGPTGEPQAGGSLTMLVNNEMRRGLDPVAGTGAAAGGDGFRMFALYGALLTLRGDDGTVEPLMAKSFTSKDFETWTLTLRPGITFTDGTPFDAEAVKFNWERHADASLGSTRYPTATRMDLKVIDPLTLEVRLDQPDATFDITIAAELTYIASPAALQKAGDYNEHPVGAGPFSLDRWQRDSEMTLVKNADYWDAPRPYLDELTIRIVPDETQRLNSFTSGEADMAWVVSASAVSEAQSTAPRFVRSNHVGDTTIEFNSEVPPFDDVRVRRAVQQAIDVELMHAAAQGEPPPEGDDLSTMFSPESPWTDPDDPTLHFPDYDPEAAQALIDEYVDETGEPISFTFIHSNVGPPVVQAEYIQAALSELDGIEMTTKSFDVPTLTNHLYEGDYQMGSSAFNGAEPFSQFVGIVETGGARNFADLSDPQIDAAIERARTSDDTARQRAAILDVQRRIIEQMYKFPSARAMSGHAVTERVGGLELVDDGIPRYDQMWLAQ